VSAPLVSAVVVNFRTAAHLAPCLDALAAASEDVPLEVILVDAASPDRVLARAAVEGASLPVDWVELPWNRGFAASANAGAARTRAPFLLFVNPDARPHPRALARLVRELENFPHGAAAGPRLVDERGIHQTGDAGYLPTARAAWMHALALPRVSRRVRGLFVADPPEPAASDRVAWLSGAFLLVRAEAFRDAGGFDEGFFLFGEDVDLGIRLSRLGLASYYVPSAVVVHEGGASYRRSKRLSPLEGRWVLGLARAHARTGAGPIERASFALALGVGLAARAVGYGLGGSPDGGSTRAERRSRARRMWAAARVALNGSIVRRGPL
jgi:GT2 family glycosyltransferase